jgi:hypothetical protein
MSKQIEAKADTYEIRIRGHLAPHRLGCFESFVIRRQPDGDTVLVGSVRDQSALYGLLSWLQDLGVTLVSVQRLGEEAAGRRHLE